VAIAALGAVFRHYLNWSDVPTWVVAITTLLAFAAADLVRLVAHDALKVETAGDLKARTKGS
jgi:hypothetical protein